MSPKPKKPDNTIAMNRKALHDYSVLEKFEAGIVLQGWELKSIRDGRVQLKDSHIFIRNGEAFLLNAQITPLTSASTHVVADPARSRKLLLHRRQIDFLMGKVEQKGFTIVPLALFWKAQYVKVHMALVQGKKEYDKRATEKARDWERERARILKKA